VTHASVQLDAVRKQIADVLSQHEQAAKNIERLEAAIPQEQDAKRAAEEEGALAAFKQSVERLTANEARLRAQEADATIVAQSEQAKWQDLTDRLSALNQSLDSGDSIIPGTQNKAK
jgi:phosphoenolpyruvate carboxylase